MSIKLTVALFVVYCLAAIIFVSEAFIFEVALNPTLPLIPAALTFCGLAFAGLAGKTFATLD